MSDQSCLFEAMTTAGKLFERFDADRRHYALCIARALADGRRPLAQDIARFRDLDSAATCAISHAAGYSRLRNSLRSAS